jgi:hypothetical protein
MFFCPTTFGAFEYDTDKRLKLTAMTERASTCFKEHQGNDEREYDDKRTWREHKDNIEKNSFHRCTCFQTNQNVNIVTFTPYLK